MSQPDDIQPLRAEANRAGRRSQAGGRRSFRTIGSSPPLPPSLSWPGRPDPAAEDRRLHTGLRSCAFLQRFAHCCPAVRAVRALIEIAAGPGVRLSVRRLHYRPARIELSRRPRSQRRLRSAPLYRKRTIPEASAIHEQVQTNRDLLTSWNTVTPGRVNNTKSNQ
jgi:hypothetical protein